MDIKKIIEDILTKIKTDKNYKNNFIKDPVKALESLTGIDLPDEQINSVIDGVKAKMTLDKAGSVIDQVKSIFDKKE